MIQSDPQAEVIINEHLVRRLIQKQHPEFKGLDIRYMDAGWDNVSYRLGDEFLIRLPRRKVAQQLMKNEIKWLPTLSGKLPVCIPAPLAIGKPDDEYPWNWSIVPWYEGTTADQHTLDREAAGQWIDFLSVLHHQDPTGAPENPNRGVPLIHKAEQVQARINNLSTRTDLVNKALLETWELALGEKCDTHDRLLHGDPHPRNILINEGAISAVIDWGDITSGDVASDLASVWMLFGSKRVRDYALEAYGADGSLTRRALGWAIFYGVVLLDTGLNGNEQHAKIGSFTLKNVLGKISS